MPRTTLGAALATALAAALLGACSSPPPRRVALERIPMPGGGSLPFSAAVRSGRFLFLSGHLGTDSTLRLVAGGIGPETRQAMENIRALVTGAGGSMNQIVKCTVMLADMSEWAAMNQEYMKFFDGVYPARSALGASGLALGARVEIECLAVLEQGAGGR